jgi:hypothetical protein
MINKKPTGRRAERTDLLRAIKLGMVLTWEEVETLAGGLVLNSNKT